jgi:hypothetical protein
MRHLPDPRFTPPEIGARRILVSTRVVRAALTGGREPSAESAGDMIMRLEVISDYEGTTTEVSDRATPELIKYTMASLDWQRFHQVLLSKANGDWLEVGGSLNPDEGLSVMWEEAGEQKVIAQPPASVAELTDFLLAFLSGQR